MQLREIDNQVTYMEQLQEDGGPVVLINVLNVAPEDAEQLLEVWADDAAFMKQQPGFISTQLHRGIAGSSTFVNVAEWESANALGVAFRSPEFQDRVARSPGQRGRLPASVPEGRDPGDQRGLEIVAPPALLESVWSRRPDR